MAKETITVVDNAIRSDKSRWSYGLILVVCLHIGTSLLTLIYVSGAM